MPFHITITRSKSFEKRLSKDETEKILCYIDKFIRDKSGKNIDKTDYSLRYKGSTSYFNWNILRAVDKGVFRIEEDGFQSKITYEYFMYQLFIVVPIMGIGFWIFSGSYLGFLLCVGWLGGMNWLITVIRHGSMFNEITEGIDTLFIELKNNK
ncbi:hypothetical protein [Mucilaginibacter gilvus]|uniref:Uncharacterized protein n=1 Tax=Mucilaginibacter gilvus TaxID=2305909 RepID=A0A444MPG3_9SPHI|nr:hypothetical protein [Mucilaginibacter gilvus]RWY52530.1 hypothetical protein EPL05_11545 [Mucilaginibacter gilvus]